MNYAPLQTSSDKVQNAVLSFVQATWLMLKRSEGGDASPAQRRRTEQKLKGLVKDLRLNRLSWPGAQ